jgi:hypothetical protein
MQMVRRILSGLSALRPKKSADRLLAIIAFCTLNLTAAWAGSRDVILTCDPNSEPNLAGYGIYFSPDVDGPPYQLYAYVGMEEMEDPNLPAFTVAGLEPEGRYYITLTAYDDQGKESGYALPVCVEVDETVSECSESPRVGDGNAPQAPAELGSPVGGSSASRSSGGSASLSPGCFIHTLAGDSLLMNILQLASLVSLAALIRWTWRWRSAD